MARFGISAALLTPFDETGAVDRARLGHHAADLMARGLQGLTLFGTTGENASIGIRERADGIACLREAGVPADRIVLGICTPSVEDAKAQIREGLDAEIATFLVPPPFYFKGVGGEGLIQWHEELMRSAGPARIILYHIPQVTGVPLPVSLVERLRHDFPDRIAALKDSSGNWAAATGYLALEGLPVLIGDERLLHRAVAQGGAGAISGVANLYPERMVRIVETATEDAALSGEVSRIVSIPVIPALKARLAAMRADPGWERVRPPLEPLDTRARRILDETTPSQGEA